MKIPFKKLICTFFALVILMSASFSGHVSSFYFSSSKLSTFMSVDEVNVKIENLSVLSDGNILSTKSNDIDFGILRVNRSIAFSFDVVNLASNHAEYTLSFDAAWELDLSGKLYVFEDTLTDEQILSMLDSGEITADLNGEVDANILQGGQSIAYSFKLFFYMDDEVSNNAEIYHNKTIDFFIHLQAKLNKPDTLWTSNNEASFKVTTAVDTVFPLIHEVHGAKTFFITQTKDIDLKAYAYAIDPLEGDITDKIVISSTPQFNPDKAGIYTIEYNVKNSINNAAAPLKINIIIWDFVKIASGNYHTLALTSHGKVYTWGFNAMGQLGQGNTADSSTPKLVEPLSGIIDIAAGTGCSFALKSDGQLYSWGRNSNGQLGDNTTTARNEPIRVHQPEGVVFISVSANFATVGAITDTGEVYTWGYGGYGAAGSGVAKDYKVPNKINLQDITHLSLGYYNGAAVDKNGILYTWGDNLHGQLGDGSSTGVGTNAIRQVPYFKDNDIIISSVSVGWYHMTATTDEGQLYTWGYGAEGRLGNNASSDKNTPQHIDMPYKVIKAQAAYYHSGVLDEKGNVYFFGQNAYGKHGSGNSTNHYTPEKLELESRATFLSLALDSSFVLIEGKYVLSMGYGGTGVLGTGNNSSSNTPSLWAFAPLQPTKR